MNIFDEIVIPASAHHVTLLRYMLTISMLLFISYISMMLGASFVSTYFNKKGKREGNNNYTNFAKDIIEKLSIANSAQYSLGLIPALSVFFAYAQLLHTTNSIVLVVMAVSIILYVISFVFIYKYKDTFSLDRILSPLASTGRIGKYMLLSATYIFSGAIALASSPDRWVSVGSIFQVIFSWQTLFNFLIIIAISGLLTGAAIMFYFFKWNGGIKDVTPEFEDLAKGFASSLSLISCVSFPLMFFISFLFLPAAALSFSWFGIIFVLLVISLLLGNFLYSAEKNKTSRFASVIFILTLILIIFNIIKDQVAFADAIHLNTLNINKLAEEHEKQTLAKVLQSTGIDAEVIYTQKCIACHKFDQKLVGPPYEVTVPKYNGDAQKLADYIFNPQKIDPAFPPMPSQGLKKKEAFAMAKWLISKTAKK